MKTQEISNSEDIIDSRDVIARIEYLTGERETLADAIDTADENDAGSAAMLNAQDALKEWDESEEAEELKTLQALAEEASGYASDWHCGAQLVRDSYFEDYARELADDIGAIPDDAQWPCTCIDWARAAFDLQMDYSAVSFGEVTYWTR